MGRLEELEEPETFCSGLEREPGCALNAVDGSRLDYREQYLI